MRLRGIFFKNSKIAQCWGKPSKMGVLGVIGFILLSNFSKVLQKLAFVQHLKKISKKLRPLERPVTQIYIT